MHLLETVTDLITLILVILLFCGMGVFVFIWQKRIRRVEGDVARFKQQLGTSFSLSGHLLDAHDEETAILTAMRTGAEVLEAEGCVFVPFDEWKHSLSLLKFGELPSQDHQWLERIGSPATRSACKICQRKQGEQDCVLLHDTHVGMENVFCVSLRRGGREIGVVSYFFRAAPQVDEETHAFLDELIRLTDLTLDSLRAREQEMAALRHFQNPSVSKEELSTLLTRLADDIRSALDIRVALFWVPPEDELRPALLVHSRDSVKVGDSAWLTSSTALEGIWQTVARSNKALALENVTLPTSVVRGGAEKYLAVPVAWLEHEPLGMLILGSTLSQKYTRRQLQLLRTVAGQAALLIQNDFLVTQLEYQAVLDERTRLSREIHDGLAQTLAFLKMEAARMQNHIANGDLDTVTQTLQACYQTLSDAYLDARQAIDNLRRTPDEEFGKWLRIVAEDFRAASGLAVQVEMLSLPQQFTPKVKAQLIRIIQEALTNVRKHAQAFTVCISAHELNGEVVIEVTDNGRGFSADDTRPTSQYGLRTMQERAESIDADFQIISKPSQGTTVRIRVPLGEKAVL